MSFINFIILLSLCSCLNPSSLDKIQGYADNEVESNVKEFSSLEIKKWWDDYFKSQAMLIVANAKTFESVQRIIDRSEDLEKRNSYHLLEMLTKLYEFNLSLKFLSWQSQNIESFWERSCDDKQIIVQTKLKEKIKRNYLSGLGLPNLSETIMLGGGVGDAGFEMMIQSIVTNVGYLFNRDKVNELKNKTDRIKKTFDEKMPSDESLFMISKDACLQSANDHRDYIKAVLPVIEEMKKSFENEWNFFLGKKRIIGMLLLKRKVGELSKTDPRLQEKLGLVAKNSLQANLTKMRSYLLNLADTLRDSPTRTRREEFEDFIFSFEEQLKLVRAMNIDGATKIAEENADFVETLKRRFI